MIKKNIGKFVFITLFLVILFIFFNFKYFENNDKSEIIPKELESEVFSSNKIKDVKYTSKDAEGNEYIVESAEGEIDYSDSSVIYLTTVKAFIKLVNSENISITSDYGKYNSENFDTLFSKNVKINYLDNNITGEYLDFSLERNSMLISRKVVYTNPDNIMEADVVEMDIQTKETKIFMLESDKKVNIKSKN